MLFEGAVPVVRERWRDFEIDVLKTIAPASGLDSPTERGEVFELEMESFRADGLRSPENRSLLEREYRAVVLLMNRDQWWEYRNVVQTIKDLLYHKLVVWNGTETREITTNGYLWKAGLLSTLDRWVMNVFRVFLHLFVRPILWICNGGR